MIKTNRRGFLATTGAGLILPAIFPHSLGAQSAVSYAPFTKHDFQQLISVAAESYIQAYVCDPSNPTFIAPFPSIYRGDAGLTWAFTTIDSAFQAAELYNEIYDLSNIPAFGSVNPYLHTFIANSAQVGLKADFFKIMSNIDFATAAGATGVTGYSMGSDLRNGIQSILICDNTVSVRKLR